MYALCIKILYIKKLIILMFEKYYNYLHSWGFTIKHINWLYPILNHPKKKEKTMNVHFNNADERRSPLYTLYHLNYLI